MNDLRLIFRYGKPYRRDLWAAAGLIFIECIFEMVIPVLMSTLVDEGVPSHNMAIILRQGGLMALCAVLALITGLLYARYAARFANGFAAELRLAEYAAVQKFDFANLDHFSSASLVTRMTTDATVLLNAITGESEYYPVAEVPSWVDNVYSPELLIEQYDYYGKYSGGFWNATFGQRNVVMTTDGYNYLAINDDVYMYTGVTSVGRDESNVGFILSNQRTKETKFYPIAGAEEYSAMRSAEGEVQHLEYTATFPLLLNIGNQPTYVIALKDEAGLVKMYAMVNVSRYQIVGAGSSIAETEQNYLRLLKDNNLYDGEVDTLPPSDGEQAETEVTSGVIADIRSAVLEGTTMYYLRLEQGETYYVVSAARNPYVILLNVGDEVEITHEKDAAMPNVTSIEKIS